MKGLVTIVGGRVVAIEARRTRDEASKGLNVNITIASVKRDGDTLTIAYEYVINYLEDVAHMRISGEVQIKESAEAAARIEKDWLERKYIEPTLAEWLLTAINYSASAVGTLAAFAIGVSAPIVAPRARIAVEEPKAA